MFQPDQGSALTRLGQEGKLNRTRVEEKHRLLEDFQVGIPHSTDPGQKIEELLRQIRTQLDRLKE